MAHGENLSAAGDRSRQPITDELASTSILEGGDETILVVEDDDLVRTFVVGQIQSLGYVTLRGQPSATFRLLVARFISRYRFAPPSRLVC